MIDQHASRRLHAALLGDRDPRPVTSIVETPKHLHEQRGEATLPKHASMRLLEALSGRSGPPLPSDASARMRAAIERRPR